jgi:hypothetical protein
MKSHIWRSVLVLIASMLLVPVAAGQTQGWSQPAPIAQGWFPDVASDATGQVHVVWASGDTTYDQVMYVTSKDGQEWSDITDVAALPQASGSEATRPALLLDRQGILHMTFRGTTVYYSQAPAESARVAANWRVPEPISGEQVGYFSRLAIDSQGRLHMVFTENIPTADCPVCYHLFYRRSEDNGQSWSAPLDISSAPNGSAKPQIVIDAQDGIHVVWEAGKGGAYGQLTDPTQVMYAASYDGGKTWTPPVQFGAPTGRSKNIALGLDGKGALLAVWLGLPEDVIYYQVSRNQGRSWSPMQAVPGVWGGWSVYAAKLDDYALATDSAGSAHLVVVGRTAQDQTSLGVLHVTWDGSTWSKLETITTLVGDVPEWPRIAVGRGNQLHVVWFVRDQATIFDSDKGNYKVWYTHGSSPAPAAAPVAQPTVTPTPTARQVVVPTATPLPRLNSAQSRVSVDSLTSENDDTLLLAKSAIPAVLLIAAIAIGLRFRRR